jgi:uncharacterized protein
LTPTLKAILLLTCSNVFMTFAWYAHLKELITLTVFVPFAFFYLKEPLKLDFLWAGLCLLGAVYFMFRDRL